MIEVRDLSKNFGKTTALDGVNITVQQGSIFGLMGSNGAGKSTLLRILSGIYRQDRGTAEVCGQSPFENPAVKERLRFLPDELWLPSGMSIEKMGRETAWFYKSWDENYFNKLCNMFPVDSGARFGSLSKGNRRQAGLILALSCRPQVLLLDEVFDGLDPVVRKLVKKLIAGEVAERSMTVVLASHNLKEMEDFCDTLALLHNGGLVLERELDGMRLGLHRIQAVFKQPPDMEKLRSRLCIAAMERSGSLYTFVIRGNESEILAGLDEFSPSFKETTQLSLEEVFISEMEACGYDIDNILG